MKTKRILRLAMVAVACLVLAFCERQDVAQAPTAQTLAENRIPADDDYVFGNMEQAPGRVTAVTIMPKNGKSPGEITSVRYDGRQEIPQGEGNFAITFDVLAAEGWDGAKGLYAGKLAVVVPTPQARDYVFGNVLQLETSGVTAVGITAKQGKSPAAVTNVLYDGQAEIPQTAGLYAVTFDVPATDGWNGADGLSAGELRIIAYQDPEDFIVRGGTLVSYTGSDGYVVIPPDSGIREIGDEAFAHNSNVVSVAVPYGVQSIVFGAFNNCTNLRSISLPETVSSIGNRAFQSTALTSVDIPYGVTSIGYAVFKYTNLVSVTIPPGVTSIGDEAFMYSRLASVDIPPGVTGIGKMAFYNCNRLASITIPSGVTSIGSLAFYNCNSLVSVAIPSGLTIIGDSAFYDCVSLVSVAVPSGVTSIGYLAFYGCINLVFVTIPSSVTSIGNGSFSSCANLQKINVDRSNKYFVSESGVIFSKDMKTLVQFPAGKTGTYTIPSGVIDIGNSAFEACNRLTSVTIPSSVTNIGGAAFMGCGGLTSVTIPPGVTSIDEKAFEFCSELASVTMSDTVRSIGWDVFDDCPNLKQINIIQTGTGSDASFFHKELSGFELVFK